MGDTLPPGWTGNENHHKRRAGIFQITIHSRRYGKGIDRFWWFVITVTAELTMIPPGPHPEDRPGTFASAPLARRAALIALHSLLTTATREATEALAELEPT